jgi:acyl-homoserine-lactone acylase
MYRALKLCSLPALFFHFFPVPSQAQTGKLNTSGQQKVTIYRDDWGVPHIYSDDEAAGFFGLGYAQAEDRLEDILKRYLAVEGRSSSVFGKTYLEKDMHNLQWLFAARARQYFNHLEPQLQWDFKQFIAGIEYYMNKHPEEVPAWAPKLDATLPVAFFYSCIFDIDEGMGVGDARQSGVQVAATKAAAEKGLSMASNGFAVSPWRTSDNTVIHLADSHVPFDGDVRAFEFRLHAGRLNVSGFSATGLVLPVTAHTFDVAWGETAGGPDVADCYAVTVDPGHPRRFKYDGAWQQMEVKSITVKVKGQPPVTREVEYTHHNGMLCPVIARKGNIAYVISSPYMDQCGMLEEQLYLMAQAKDMEQFKQALSLLGFMSQNLIAGSADGHVLYLRAGRVPIRPAGYNFREAVSGNSSATAWKGIYPLDKLVVVEDPAAGYLTNENGSPDMMTVQRTIDAAKYPFEVFYDQPGFIRWRGQRELDLLSRSYQMTLSDAENIALDEKWAETENWTTALQQALDRESDSVQGKSEEFRRVVGQLVHFDGMARKESVAALLYIYWRRALPDSVTWQKPSPQMVTAIQNAIAALKKDFGRTDLELGDVYRIGRGGVSLPIGGVTFYAHGQEQQTLRAMLSFAPPDSVHRIWIDAGQRQPMLTFFTHPLQSFTYAPWGQSEHPSSPHYADQSRLLSERRLKSDYFSKEELMKHVESTTVLNVKLLP